MKITISFTAPEEQLADSILAALMRFLPGARMHRAGTPPNIRVYVTTRKPKDLDRISPT